MMGLVLDEWQGRVLACRGDVVLRSGRQVGKSTVISVKGGDFACCNSGVSVLIVAAVERQAQLLFEKVLSYVLGKYKRMVLKGRDRPTKSRLRLSNGSVIRCLPTGLSGIGIRGYTIDLLIADEAAFIPEDVWTAITPMLAVTKGDKILLSTPHGKRGYFYDCFNDSSYTAFHVSSEDCPRISKEYLSRERERMSAVQYAQEYLGEFVDELRQFFPTSLVKDCLSLEVGVPRWVRGKKFLGVDVARLGGDETILASLELLNDDYLSMFDLDSSKCLTTESVDRILGLDRIHNYSRIYVDDGGLGVAVFDPLLSANQTKRKVVAINNAKRVVDKDGKRARLLKEDLYSNLLRLMELGKVRLFNTPEVLLSFTSIQYEYTESGIKIYGNYSHIVEAIIRAAWCVKDKGLKLWIR